MPRKQMDVPRKQFETKVRSEGDSLCAQHDWSEPVAPSRIGFYWRPIFPVLQSASIHCLSWTYLSQRNFNVYLTVIPRNLTPRIRFPSSPFPSSSRPPLNFYYLSPTSLIIIYLTPPRAPRLRRIIWSNAAIIEQFVMQLHPLSPIHLGSWAKAVFGRIFCICKLVNVDL